MDLAPLPAAPRWPSGPAPLRRAGAVRRTSSMDMTWPQGRGRTMRFVGTARDLLTPLDHGAPRVLALDRVEASIEPDRSIAAIAAEPQRAAIARLVGARGGGYLRQAIDEALPDEREAGTPLYLLLDDISGASLIAGWAWSRRPGSAERPALQAPPGMETPALRVARMESICTGFRPGSSALDDVTGAAQNCTPVEQLHNAADPIGWHAMPVYTETSMRRARRIDVWHEAGMLRVDAMFQDSASLPDGSRVAIHEYTLQASADVGTLVLQSVQAQPRTLPYPECPSAVDHIALLVGTPLSELRSVVLQRLRKVAGCTHLNDALRALAEVPRLAATLPGRADGRGCSSIQQAGQAGPV